MLYVRGKDLILVFFVFLLLLNIYCSTPRKISSKKDIEKSEVESIKMETKVLVASQSSDFKNAIIEKLMNSFQKDRIYVKNTGLNELKDESAESYSTVVIINTCIYGGMDPKVDDFLNRYKDNSNIIVLTTSGDGDWLPKKKGREFDAISSASEMTKVDDVTNEIITEVQSRI